MNSFKEIEEYVKKHEKTVTIALASAHDYEALYAVVEAHKKGVAKAILIGDTKKISELLKEMKETEENYEIIESNDDEASANLAVYLVQTGKADIPMKGLMQTATFMRAILNKEGGLLNEGDLLSQASLLEFAKEKRFLIISDCAVNINPSLDDKVKIINNAITLANKVGIKKPKIAVLSALEVVNSKIPSTVDAVALAKMDFKDAIIDGPLALDNAISKEAAKHKGITSKVAGDADILLMPDLCSGNIFSKSLVFFADAKMAGTLNGTTSPVIMTSRTETKENKYYSILTAILQKLN